MPFPINPKKDRAWLRYATERAEQPVYKYPREPKPIERLAAYGFTRRVGSGLVWFAHQDGRTTPQRETVGEAVKAALEVVLD